MDERDCADDITLDKVRVEPKHAHAVGGDEKAVATLVILAPRSVNAAVDLDDQPMRSDEEVDDAGMKDVLPPHPRPEPPSAKPSP